MDISPEIESYSSFIYFCTHHLQYTSVRIHVSDICNINLRAKYEKVPSNINSH
jgi:hypothetical protein